MTQRSPEGLGIIIPCYNEEAVLSLLFKRLDALPEVLPCPMKLLFVDDGSKDATWEMLSTYCEARPHAAAIKLSRNFGHQTAVSAGLANIDTPLVGVIDADLQDPPELFAEMIEAWQQGNDVVFAIRENRKEGALLKFSYWLFYRTLKKVANIDIPLDSGDFALMDAAVVRHINAMPEQNRFVRGLRGWVGYKQIGIPYNREKRAAGEAKYTFKKLLRLAMDGLISFSSVPLRLAGWLGVVSTILGLLYVTVEIIRLFFFEHPPSGWASTIALIVFFGGIQLLMLGVIGEYLGRIFDEVKRRPVFVSSSTCGWIASQKLKQPGHF